jgi:hypothetical protein
VFEPPAGELRLDEELVELTDEGLNEATEIEDELQLVVEEVVEELDVEPLARYRPAPTPTTNRMTITAAGITNLLPLFPVLPDIS